MSGACAFNRAWMPRCGAPAPFGAPFCPEHEARKCAVCGGQAVKECDTAGSLVCGTPLCATCACSPCEAVQRRYEAEEVARVLMRDADTGTKTRGR